MKVEEIKNIPTKELVEKLNTEKNNYRQMLLTHAISPLADTSKIKAKRRDIARMMTILRQREINK